MDTSFGTGGVVATGFNNHTAQASAIALQPNGRAVVAGYSVSGTNGTNFDTNFAIARYSLSAGHIPPGSTMEDNSAGRPPGEN
jgi:hypothetical protein